jgi:predicted CoA-binding protein
VEQAIKLKAACGKPNVVWMQLGIVDKKASETAKKAGLIVVMDKCMSARLSTNIVSKVFFMLCHPILKTQQLQ